MKVKPTQYTISETDGHGCITLTFQDYTIEENIIPSEHEISVLIENEDNGQYVEFRLTAKQLNLIGEYGNKLLFEHAEDIGT